MTAPAPVAGPVKPTDLKDAKPQPNDQLMCGRCKVQMFHYEPETWPEGYTNATGEVFNFSCDACSTVISDSHLSYSHCETCDNYDLCEGCVTKFGSSKLNPPAPKSPRPKTPLGRSPKLAPTAAPAAASAAAGKEPETVFKGQCLCKAVKIQAVGKPMFSVFCHCTICARLGNTDRQMLVGWVPSKCTVTEGKNNMTAYASSDKAVRHFCKTCGTPVMNVNTAGRFVDCSPTLFGTDDKYRVPRELLPSFHMHVGSSCLLGSLPNGTGLPLLKDTPKQYGGSGEVLPPGN